MSAVFGEKTQYVDFYFAFTTIYANLGMENDIVSFG